MACRKEMLTTLQAMEIVTNADSDADMLPVDSESDDEDLLQPERNPERCDSDDEIPPRESDGDEDEMAL
ncbi:hypothetical protein OYC64_013565 [Pagothenia borchgrevinki]|uniref:Uncharacterized protein n=1 Tax=Pagothenia borchgrevinki TaxID=8213 RepID=A0ABD2FUG8_PAGBO